LKRVSSYPARTYHLSADEFTKIRKVPLGHKGKSFTLSSHTTGSASAVSVLFSVSREIPINNVGDMGEIKPPPGYIAGNEGADLFIPESPEY
jgi:hypothetical protein